MLVGGVCVRAVLRKTDAAVGIFGVVGIKKVVVLVQFTQIPAKIQVVAVHIEDMALILEMGANTIRLAHYQHAQAFYDLCDEKGLVIWAEIPYKWGASRWREAYFYDLCDKYGMVVWAEIPYISEHLPNGRGNTISQMKELIHPGAAHPDEGTPFRHRPLQRFGPRRPAAPQ